MKIIALSLVVLALVALGTAGVYYASGVNAHGACSDPDHEKNITAAGDPEHYSQHRDSDDDGVVCEDGSAVTPQNTPEPTPTPTLMPTPTPTPAPTLTPQPTPSALESEQAALAAATPHGRQLSYLPYAPPIYNRADYGDWADVDGDCQDTRQELLIERSQVQAELSADGCSVAEGSWVDRWTGNLVASPEDLDLDHHIPLANAHRSGGHRWTREQKRQFANDPDNLNFTNADFNRNLKQDKSPDQFSEEAAAAVNDRCQYAKEWIDLKSRYNLAVTDAERATLLAWLTECPAPAES